MDNTTNATVLEDTSIIIIIIVASSGGGAVILLATVIVILVVCLRRSRKRRRVIPPLPNPFDSPLVQPSGDKGRNTRRNSENVDQEAQPSGFGLIPDWTRISNERSPKFEKQNETQLVLTSTSKLKSKQRVVANYENVVVGDDDDDDDDVSDDNSMNGSPNYENNPVLIAKANAEAAFRLQKRRHGTDLPLARSPVLNKTRIQVTAARQAQTLGAPARLDDSTRCLWSSKDAKQFTCSAKQFTCDAKQFTCDARQFTFDHTPTTSKGYVNTSRSLEDLDRRVVPPPPPLSFNPSLMKKRALSPPPPPKPHSGKPKGYVNQPSY